MGETVEKIYCCDRDNNDTLNNHWKDEQALKIQDLKFELSQERQNNLINERFNRLGNCGCGGNSCGCGCGQ